MRHISSFPLGEPCNFPSNESSGHEFRISEPLYLGGPGSAGQGPSTSHSALADTRQTRHSGQHPLLGGHSPRQYPSREGLHRFEPFKSQDDLHRFAILTGETGYQVQGNWVTHCRPRASLYCKCIHVAIWGTRDGTLGSRHDDG